MAKYKFGIMDITPKLKQEYNTNKPKKYHCFSVEDEIIELLLKNFPVIPCYWYSPNEKKGCRNEEWKDLHFDCR